MAEKNKNEMIAQSAFCLSLMARLDADIMREGITYGYLNNYTQLQKDIVRLRRELSFLSRLLNPWDGWTRFGGEE